MTISRRGRRWRVAVVIAVLITLHFYIRPWFGGGAAAPDLLMLAMLLVAIRSRPGTAAVIGFTVGLVTDILTPARFGAGAMAHTVVGYLAAWGRGLFFPDNLLVNAGVFAGGVWLRTLLVLIASGAGLAELGRVALVWSPIQAVTTAIAGVTVVVIFRDWLAIRLDE
ncbi:MAG: rod shape-determining protein MreD [Gemmatimonadetes bacterium]|nr:rod shape-determining protein MreD [Gemmatimonadota bacterium]